ncbi:putative heterokaryon incompatibility protein [Botrytis fragariae]|uniref:Putative heterokaryon incompatibility protein n=1 Tax=Botrytis fragariae TaxID=1964551 RepID=A0A8H6AJK8_9HELO|nr:putative heterokaryon incompatibility protein [Botrytis fragariae]KAF5868423.1 putative heterokaryon incompatibility protein [Botrytis fragariae]
MLCNVCHDIHFKPKLQLTRREKISVIDPEAWPTDDDDNECYEEQLSDDDINEALEISGLKGELFYFHHPNLKTLRKSADNGCPFCYQLYNLLEQHILEEAWAKELFDKNDSLEVYLCYNPHENEISSEREQDYLGALRVNLGPEIFVYLRLKDQNVYITQKYYGNSTTGSTTNFSLAARWLEDCMKNHTQCSAQLQMNTELPLRVLDVGEIEGSKRVFLSVGKRGKKRFGSYAALSYCWGKETIPPRHFTTSRNIETLKEAIDVSNLPRTLTDSFLVCRHLGIKFIWIDALCIIQDDPDDWNDQACQMSHIYSNSILTIAAAIGDNSQASLFVQDPRRIYPTLLNFQYTTDDGTTTRKTSFSCLDMADKQWGHLDTRGWAFQEKFLPIRTLRFSKSGMHWICASKNANEGLPMGMKPSNSKADYDHYIRNDKKCLPASSLDNRQRYLWWYQAVVMYSHRNFTHESDRLIALSGLALAFQELPNDYFYGLWKSDIAYGLAWSLLPKNNESIQNTQNTQSASSLPSWSWASRPGYRIVYHNPGIIPGWDSTGVDEDYLDTSVVNCRKWEWEPYQKCLFVEVSKLVPESSTKDSGGLNSNGLLRLRSSLLRVLLLEPVKDLDCPKERFFTAYKLTDYSSSQNDKIRLIRGKASFDEHFCVADDLYILPLFGVQSSPDNCLLLKKIDKGEMMFRRLGFLNLWEGKDNFVDEVPVTLVLV